MDQAGNRAVRVFGEAVFHHAVEGLQFAPQRNDLPANRAERIVGVDQAGEIGRNIDAEYVVRRQAFDFFGRQVNDLRQFVKLS